MQLYSEILYQQADKQLSKTKPKTLFPLPIPKMTRVCFEVLETREAIQEKKCLEAITILSKESSNKTSHMHIGINRFTLSSLPSLLKIYYKGKEAVLAMA